MKRIKHGSKADHARMKPRYADPAKTAQNALREQIDTWFRVIINNPQKSRPTEFYEAKNGILSYARGGKDVLCDNRE
jgi:hypothetical protein